MAEVHMICVTILPCAEPSVTGRRASELRRNRFVTSFGVRTLKATRATCAVRRTSFSAGPVVRSQMVEPDYPRSGESRLRSAPLSGGIEPHRQHETRDRNGSAWPLAVAARSPAPGEHPGAAQEAHHGALS